MKKPLSPLRLLRPTPGKVALWLLSLLLFAALLFRLSPRPQVAEDTALLSFRCALSHPSLVSALAEEPALRIGEYPVSLLEGSLGTEPSLRAPGEVGAPCPLPSKLRETAKGTLLCRGKMREGSFFLGGSTYLAPGMTVTLEGDGCVFLVQILSISTDIPL